MAFRRSLRFQLYLLTVPLAVILLCVISLLIMHLLVMLRESSSLPGQVRGLRESEKLARLICRQGVDLASYEAHHSTADAQAIGDRTREIKEELRRLSAEVSGNPAYARKLRELSEAYPQAAEQLQAELDRADKSPHSSILDMALFSQVLPIIEDLTRESEEKLTWTTQDVMIREQITPIPALRRGAVFLHANTRQVILAERVARILSQEMVSVSFHIAFPKHPVVGLESGIRHLRTHAQAALGKLRSELANDQYQDAASRALVQTAEQQYGELQQLEDQVWADADAPAQGSQPDEEELHRRKVNEAVNGILGQLDNLAQNQESQLAKAIVEATDAIRHTMIVVIGACLALMLFGFASPLVVFRLLVSPMTRLKAHAAQIAKGDFGARVSVSSNSELAELAEAFNCMSWEVARTKQEDAQHIHQLQEAKLAAEALARAKSAIVGEMGREIERRKRAEEATEFLVDAIPIAVLATRADGVITRWNQAAADILGVSRQHATARRLADCGVRWLDKARIVDFERDLVEKLDAKQENAALLRGDKDKRLVALTGRQIRGHRYSDTFVVTAADVTEKRSLEAQVNHAQKMEAIGQLSAGIAHEINTPIQYVGDNLMFLSQSWTSVADLVSKYRCAVKALAATALSDQQRGALADAEQKADFDFMAEEIPRAIEQAVDGAQRVAKIVHAMKEFSHPGSSERTAVDINKTVETTVTVARNEWKYVANVQTVFDPNLPLVPCYAGELNQVILNLIVNAAHAIGEVVQNGQKGVIRIQTADKGEWAEIRVSDTGSVIPAAIRNRIFDPFFTTKEVGKGTGQGLALSHSVVVKKHGGKIWFETEVGRGTTFFLHLPIHSTMEPEI